MSDNTALEGVNRTDGQEDPSFADYQRECENWCQGRVSATRHITWRLVVVGRMPLLKRTVRPGAANVTGA